MTAYPDAFYQRALQLIGSLSEMLMERKMLLGTAESCTGGLVAALCTEAAGSSSWFAGGVVSYANEVKQALLGVDAGLLAAHGAVSKEVAEAMALGALSALRVQASIAISGIAGPGGGSLEKPVGTVWIAAALHMPGLPDKLSAERCHFSGTRQEVRAAAALRALESVGQLLWP